ncbi:MAG: M56 family metallopeptidase [Lachnospiraceae bacterium]|nr:M56 family metallopeptidase [Lachnospiraceae bacterium]
MMRFVSFLVGSESLIGMMFLIRVLLRGKIPPGILYALWLVPAVRLLIPFTLIPVPVLPEAVGEAAGFDEGVEKAAADYRSAAIRVVSAAQTTVYAAIAENAQDAGRVGNGGITEASFLAENREYMQETAKVERIVNRKRMDILSCLSCIWLSGSVLCGGYVVLINQRLKRSIKQMERLAEKRLVPVYIREEVVSPCLFGLFHPCILLSKQTVKNKELCRQALLHEETHYRQKDHIWTAFRISLCVLYWWNPLVWMGAAYAREDAEFACDARALKDASLSEKKDYGYALLEILQGAQASGTLVQGITPVSGKGKNMKRRLENIVSEHKRTGLWTLPACLLLILFLCGFCFPAQRVDAKEETIEEPNAQMEGELGKMMLEEPEPVKEEKGGEVANRIKDVGTENGREERAEESESGIRVRPQEHREGYREPDLRYTASADWLTDLTGRLEEQETTENLARRALRELYDLTGYQMEACSYGYNEIGMLFFALSEEDMEHSRIFYSYSMGEKDGYGIIPSIEIANARRVWYSDVQQLALPESAASMEKEQLAIWFLEHSPLCPEGVIVKTELVDKIGAGCLKLTMEDGTFYEINIDMEILAVNNIYGPYPPDAQH